MTITATTRNKQALQAVPITKLFKTCENVFWVFAGDTFAQLKKKSRKYEKEAPPCGNTGDAPARSKRAEVA
jgi:hypothetical protein